MSCRSLEDPLLLPLNVWAFLVFGAKVNEYFYSQLKLMISHILKV